MGLREMLTTAVAFLMMSLFASPEAVMLPWASKARAWNRRPGPTGIPVTRPVHCEPDGARSVVIGGKSEPSPGFTVSPTRATAPQSPVQVASTCAFPVSGPGSWWQWQPETTEKPRQTARKPKIGWARPACEFIWHSRSCGGRQSAMNLHSGSLHFGEQSEVRAGSAGDEKICRAGWRAQGVQGTKPDASGEFTAHCEIGASIGTGPKRHPFAGLGFPVSEAQRAPRRSVLTVEEQEERIGRRKLGLELRGARGPKGEETGDRNVSVGVHGHGFRRIGARSTQANRPSRSKRRRGARVELGHERIAVAG